jgi:hypothetical protein
MVKEEGKWALESSYEKDYRGFNVLKSTIFWDMTPSSPVVH